MVFNNEIYFFLPTNSLFQLVQIFPQNIVWKQKKIHVSDTCEISFSQKNLIKF